MPADAAQRPGSDGDSRLILAIDQGTSATKAVLVDESGGVCHKASTALGQQFPRPGWAEQDPNEIWSSVQQAVAECLHQVDASQVVAVGMSTQRESMLLWDRRSGDPLGPVLGWQDTRGASFCTAIREAGHADKVRHITGLPLDAMFSAAKAAALLAEHDPDRGRTRSGELCLGTVDSWLLWKLGGAHQIEVGNASRTQLLDISSGRWDPWLLELFDIPVQALPEVVGSTGPFVTCRALEPLPTGVPVTGVLGDSHAALFAHAGWRLGQVKATYGTGSSVMGVTEGRPAAASGVVRSIAWQLDEPCYALEGNIRSSGATLVWLARFLDTTPAELAARAAADSAGVTVVPAFTGLGAPWWDDGAQAMITGLSEAAGVGQVVRAALESIAFQVEDVVAAIEAEAAPVGVILADGGPTSNSDLMQLQADTSGRQVMTSEVSELSALGAAHLAGVGAGLWTMPDLEQLDRPRTSYQPRDSSFGAPTRQDRRDRWHRSVAAARTLPKGQQ